MIITIFGGSESPDEINQVASEIGKRIAKKGYTLKNGGGAGTMEAAAKACTENGGKAIGICVKSEKMDCLNYTNPFLTETIILPTFKERRDELLKADMFIVLPGQTGTIDEFFSAWLESLAHHEKLLYLFGERNIKLFNYLCENGFVRKEEEKLIKLVRTVDEIDFLN
jgi:uncharacterized protein (TIGR00730 family)